jgi:5-deoxy-D-glucuronate isomerase
MMYGCRSLDDDELVEEGDIIKDVEAGEYREVAVDSFDALAIGLDAGAVRKWDNVNDVLRRVSVT